MWITTSVDVDDVCRAYWADGSPLDLLSNPEAAAHKGGVPFLRAQVTYNAGTMLNGVTQYKKGPGCSIWQAWGYGYPDSQWIQTTP